MCELRPSVRALMTLPSACSEKRIFLASSRRAPTAPVLSTRSDPARSTMVRVERMTVIESRRFCVMCSWKMEWLRLLRSFMCVDAVERCAAPSANASNTCSDAVTDSCAAPATNTPRSGSSRIWRPPLSPPAPLPLALPMGAPLRPEARALGRGALGARTRADATPPLTPRPLAVARRTDARPVPDATLRTEPPPPPPPPSDRVSSSAPPSSEAAPPPTSLSPSPPPPPPPPTADSVSLLAEAARAMPCAAAAAAATAAGVAEALMPACRRSRSCSL